MIWNKTDDVEGVSKWLDEAFKVIDVVKIWKLIIKLHMLPNMIRLA